MKKTQSNFRHYSLFFIFSFFFLVANIRSCELTLLSEKIRKSVDRPYNRGQIFSRDGAILSFNSPNHYLYLNNKKGIHQSQIPIESLSSIINMPSEDILSILEEKEEIILLKTNISVSAIQELRRLENSNIIVDTVLKRQHPYPNILAHTLGFISRDQKGLGGIEQSYNEILTSKKKGKQKDIVLSINLPLQRHVEKVLDQVMDQEETDSGFVIIQEIETGFIRAMVNRPNFNLNHFQKENPKKFINNITSGVVEPGSIMKIFFLAYLIENNLISQEDIFNCTGSVELINGEVIQDTGVHGNVNMEGIIQYSCNSAMIQAMDQVSKEDMYDFLKDAYFMKKTGIKLPGETSSIIPSLKNWGIRNTAIVPIGYGFSISPIQLISSYNALLNNGIFVEPRVVKEVIIQEDTLQKTLPIEKIERPPFISTETSKKIIDLLYHGTKPNSTGSKANIRNYISIGKTSTSQLVNRNRNYTSSGEHHAMFIGSYPSKKPKFSILIGVNRPQKNRFGGSIAAPLYSKIIEEAIRSIEIEYFRPQKTLKNITLEKISVEYNSDIMPNFRGKSLREVFIITKQIKKYMSSTGRQVSFSIEGGVGYVQEQSFRPGTKLENGMHIIITLKD